MVDQFTRALPLALKYGDVWSRARAERWSYARVTSTNIHSGALLVQWVVQALV